MPCRNFSNDMQKFQSLTISVSRDLSIFVGKNIGSTLLLLIGCSYAGFLSKFGGWCWFAGQTAAALHPKACCWTSAFSELFLYMLYDPWLCLKSGQLYPSRLSRCDLKIITFHHALHFFMHNAKVKSESPEAGCAFSPETSALIQGLSDSPESLQLKAEILRSANELKRGPFEFDPNPILLTKMWFNHRGHFSSLIWTVSLWQTIWLEHRGRFSNLIWTVSPLTHNVIKTWWHFSNFIWSFQH